MRLHIHLPSSSIKKKRQHTGCSGRDQATSIHQNGVKAGSTQLGQHALIKYNESAKVIMIHDSTIEKDWESFSFD